jgi:hypothetical protein
MLYPWGDGGQGWGKGSSSSTSGGLMITRQMISSPSASSGMSDPTSTITCRTRSSGLGFWPSEQNV